MRYHILNGNADYVYLVSFSSDMGAGNLDNMLCHLVPYNGLIIDIRSDGGGMLTSAEQLATRSTNKESLMSYMQHKAGRGHRDFSELREQHLKSSEGLRQQKKAIVPTNQQVFSAVNEFIRYIKECPDVTIMGDRTDGGVRLPFSSGLPNGWGVRFSVYPMYDMSKQSTEFDIDPGYRVDISHEDFL